jgi:hypothetical protein
MGSYDTTGKYLGMCACFPEPGEEHIFGEVLYRFKEYNGGCVLRLVFEIVE